jgi:hypothetical protein
MFQLFCTCLQLYWNLDHEYVANVMSLASISDDWCQSTSWQQEKGGFSVKKSELVFMCSPLFSFISFAYPGAESRFCLVRVRGAPIFHQTS